MPRFLATVLAGLLTLPAHATIGTPLAYGEQPPTPSGQASLGEPAKVVDRAEAAWEQGEWSRVRNLLEPLVLDPKRLQDPIVREKALTYLADATLADETLDPLVRRQLAITYIDRLLDADPDYKMPDGIYSPEIATLFAEVIRDRGRTEAARCEIDLNACRADRAQEQSEHGKLEKRYAALQRAYADQEVEVRTERQRSRLWALVPGGVGHFYNGWPWLGASFLAAEVAFGATGLGLLIRRVTVDGCVRTNGFRPGSLQCENPDGDALKRRREAEEVMGWFLLGTVALDIVLAQILFRPTETTSVRRVRRRDLPTEQEVDPREKRRKKRRAKVGAAPALIPNGAGLGLDVRF